MTTWLSPIKAAAIAGVSVPTIKRAIRAGALPAWRLQPGGRLLRIRQADIEAWASSQKARASR